MRAYLNSGEILEGRQCVVRRAVAFRKKHDKNLKVRFSSPFSELEECVYHIRTGEMLRHLSKWFPAHIIAQAMEVCGK